MEHAIPYRTYWLAWITLLAITLVMVFIVHPAILILGMALKATIIVLWFMHLKYERLEFALGVSLAVVATGLLLFGLISPDGLAM